MRIATQSQVTTKVNAIKQALNSFNYSHRCIYYYSNNTINSSWSTNIQLPNDGKSYRVVLCYTFSANPFVGSSSSRYGMIVDLAIGNHTERVIQGFSSACAYYFNASKNNISTGLVSLIFTGQGQTIPVSITLNFVGGNSTLQEKANLSGFQLAVVEIPSTIGYERM